MIVGLVFPFTERLWESPAIFEMWIGVDVDMWLCGHGVILYVFLLLFE